MKLEPLKQWVCDACREIIEKPEDGYLEWIDEGGKGAKCFKIVHHGPASPRKPGSDCYHYSHAPGRMDDHLDAFVGPEGLAQLLAMVDPGEQCEPDYKGPDIADFRSWVTTLRRLFVPSYEEATLYWRKACEDGFILHQGPSIYGPEFLRSLVEKYRPA